MEFSRSIFESSWDVGIESDSIGIFGMPYMPFDRRNFKLNMSISNLVGREGRYSKMRWIPSKNASEIVTAKKGILIP